MTDGRKDMIVPTLESFRQNVRGDISCMLVNDDSGDKAYQDWLANNLRDLIGSDVPILVNTVHARSGFGGAIRNAWRWVADLQQSVWGGVDFDWVFHLEDDFTFPSVIDLNEIRSVMETHPYLAQMALRRQPWGSDLQFEGGFIEAKPELYTEHSWMRSLSSHWWIETRRNWTTNPSLFRWELCKLGWPDDPFSEGKYGFVLKEERGLPWGIPPDQVQFGIWGRLEDKPRCTHIGTYRVGTLY